MPSWPLWLFLLAINASAFLAFGLDKRRAVAKRRRLSERSLLILAAFGGTLGVYLARALFRHKTRKRPFATALHLIAFAQVAILAALFIRP